jgi:hypothetical protein
LFSPRILPRDGKSSGRFMVRGPWVPSGYYGEEELLLEGGWFNTGDSMMRWATWTFFGPSSRAVACAANAALANLSRSMQQTK